MDNTFQQDYRFFEGEVYKIVLILILMDNTFQQFL